MTEGEITSGQIPPYEFNARVYIYRDGEVWWGSWNNETQAWNPWHRLGVSDPHPFNDPAQPAQPVQSDGPVDTPPEHKYVEGEAIG